jgi:hypothetical protein
MILAGFVLGLSTSKVGEALLGRKVSRGAGCIVRMSASIGRSRGHRGDIL